MEKIDLRIIKTKKNIYQSLEELMRESPFEEIKVSDLCEKALINRSTFYSHYNDKYELLKEYIDDLKNSLALELERNKKIKNTKEYYMEMIHLLLNHIESKKDVYLSIMIHNKNSVLMDIVYDVINRDIMKQIKEANLPNTIPSDILSKFYLGGVFNVCTQWLIQKNKYSKKELLNYFSFLIPDNIEKH